MEKGCELLSKICNFTEIRSNFIYDNSLSFAVVNCFQKFVILQRFVPTSPHHRRMFIVL